ncbi:hypothetical protein QYM36_010372 [Artemia franciscana]|uniref:Reverse transcriptase domain-containing protein n=1 Tax=Artemia franciscana TaxID=6661 RepID=A0AA88LBY5_ARTSF|nr:hypothetical protein QYM36_010372 [Artemia franciscana]
MNGIVEAVRVGRPKDESSPRKLHVKLSKESSETKRKRQIIVKSVLYLRTASDEYTQAKSDYRSEGGRIEEENICFSVIDFDKEYIYQKLKKLNTNKSEGSDDVRPRILRILRNFGIAGKALDWITNFLEDRTHRAKADCHISTAVTKVSSGIPQGVSGPLLSSLFANDLPENISSDITLYSGDTKLFRPIKCPNLMQELQTDLNKIVDWLRTQEMEDIPNKSSHLCLGPENFKCCGTPSNSPENQIVLMIDGESHLLGSQEEQKEKFFTKSKYLVIQEEDYVELFQIKSCAFLKISPSRSSV